MPDGELKIPDQKELEKELQEYLSKKFGAKVKIMSPLMSKHKDQQDNTLMEFPDYIAARKSHPAARISILDTVHICLESDMVHLTKKIN